MTKGQPGETTDHVHQKSMWFCHGDVIPDVIDLYDRVPEKSPILVRSVRSPIVA